MLFFISIVFNFSANPNDKINFISFLVDGVDPNKPDPDNDDQTAIHAAAIGGHLAILHILIQVSIVETLLTNVN